MQSLKNVQTWAQVFKVFTIIAIVFLSIGIVAGLISFISITNQGIFEEINNLLIENGDEAITHLTAPNLLISIISMLASLVVEILTLKYINKELADGTPFTYDGSKQLFWLAIIGLILPAVASAISGIIVLSYGITFAEVEETITGVSFGYAIGLIILSQIFKYGAELREKKSD